MLLRLFNAGSRLRALFSVVQLAMAFLLALGCQTNRWRRFPTGSKIIARNRTYSIRDYACDRYAVAAYDDKDESLAVTILGPCADGQR